MIETDSFELLSRKGIRPSPQRVAILDSLCGRRDHPTVEMVFEDLRPSMPTLSKTTVLDTMRRLQAAGLVRDVRCEEGELRFDGGVEFHAHFKCRRCGGLFDLAVAGGHDAPYVRIPGGFAADDEQLIYYGLCRQCNKSTRK